MQQRKKMKQSSKFLLAMAILGAFFLVNSFMLHIRLLDLVYKDTRGERSLRRSSKKSRHLQHHDVDDEGTSDDVAKTIPEILHESIQSSNSDDVDAIPKTGVLSERQKEIHIARIPNVVSKPRTVAVEKGRNRPPRRLQKCQEIVKLRRR